MRVFISWSGERSKAVAIALHGWLPYIMQSVKPWTSGVDIQAGARWSREVEDQLEDTQFGIVCLTKENQSAPWLLFEAGALAKSIAGAFVCPYLIDLTPSEVAPGPLILFQAKQATREDTRDIVVALNDGAPEGERLGKDQVLRTFERWWPDLQATLASLPPSSRTVEKRPPSEIMDELLDSNRQIARQMTEALSRLAASGRQERETVAFHQLRLTGDPLVFDQLIADLQRGYFGVRVVQQQRMSDNTIWVNLQCDSTFNVTVLLERVKSLGLGAELLFVNL